MLPGASWSAAPVQPHTAKPPPEPRQSRFPPLLLQKAAEDSPALLTALIFLLLSPLPLHGSALVVGGSLASASLGLDGGVLLAGWLDCISHLKLLWSNYYYYSAVSRLP